MSPLASWLFVMTLFAPILWLNRPQRWSGNAPATSVPRTVLLVVMTGATAGAMIAERYLLAVCSALAGTAVALVARRREALDRLTDATERPRREARRLRP